jgi:hypothetical protein
LSPPVGQRHLDRLAQDTNPGIGHHYIQTSEAPLGGFDYCRPTLLHSHVVMKIDRFAPSAADLLRHRLACGIVQVGYHDFGAFPRQCRRTSRPNPRCPAGYDRDLAVHLAHSVLQSAGRR